MRKILCIGTCCNAKLKIFTGQSVMFDGVVNHLKKKGENVDVIDLFPKKQNWSVLYRSLEYVVKLTVVFWKLLLNYYKLCYLTTAQSKNGFIRDYAIISMCRWFHVPVVAHQYGANLNQLLDALDEKGIVKLKSMLDYVSYVVVEGNYMKEQYSFLSDYKTKVKVIPNGLPIEGKRAGKAKSYENGQTFQMFYLSNLIWSKGYFDVLQAVNILINKCHLNVRCVFAGNFMPSRDDERQGISNKDDFDKYIAENGLSDKVEYHIGLYGEKKDEYFFKSNVFLLPTYYINEGQPVSIIEAMAYGCVPIVTEYRHIPMMISENNGCFVLPKNPEDIVNCVKELMAKPDTYRLKSERCITDYKEKFKFDVFADKVIECFNSVITER